MSAPAYRVAVITGGASGIGLAVALALVRRKTEKWHVHSLDRNEPSDDDHASEFQDMTFHKLSVVDWPALSTTFDKIYKSEGRLDFVFANAGITEVPELFEKHDDVDGPPPALKLLTLDINLNAVITTSYLAAHYLRKSKKQNAATQEDAHILCTSSCAGLYGDANFSVYTASKHGVLGFVRSVAPTYLKDGIRTNCLCPGSVDTHILGTGARLSTVLSKDVFTPIQSIVDAVLVLVDNKAAVDANGNRVEDGKVHRVVAEVNLDKYFFRKQVDYCDPVMEELCSATLANIEL